MSRTLGVVMDPIGAIKPYKDTTLALLLAAQRHGYAIRYFEMNDLWVRDGVALGRGRALNVRDDAHDWFTSPLELAETQGCLVVNRPQSLRDCNEKFFISRFPQCCAPTLIASDPATLRAFHAEHGDVIFKPLDGMGGSGIFRVGRDGLNLGAVIEALTAGRHLIMAQRYLPAIKDGDKRILMVDGAPVPYCLARVPMQGETRGNLAAGGSGRPQPLTERDRWIANQVGPELQRRGLLFVGLDVIGDCLTEINVTSPTCARELDAAYALDIGGQLMQAITARLVAR